uniref:Uncharacterized protein n=1 Tax=Plectus sambesii TaxID=2011161 RepID=A0A914X434_9BILA
MSSASTAVVHDQQLLLILADLR